jgi:hypothetical protein
MKLEGIGLKNNSVGEPNPFDLNYTPAWEKKIGEFILGGTIY